MSKASDSWQKIVNLLILLVKDKKLRKTGKWLGSCLVVVILWWLHWKLFLATMVGIGSMTTCYLIQNSYWQRYYHKWQKFLVGSNRQLALAVGTGATAAFCTYLAASVWVDADNQWLATGAILQGFTSLTTLSILLWSLWYKQDRTAEARLDSFLRDLSHRDSLKRLIAIRQVTRLLIQQSLSTDLASQSIEYFRLMLSEPQLPVVRNALLESLELLTREQLSTPSQPLVRIPMQLKPTRKPIKIRGDYSSSKSLLENPMAKD